MNTQTLIPRITHPNPMTGPLRTACTTSLLPLLLLLALPAAVQAQFNYTINGGTITITGYTGPRGAVTIPSTINGRSVTSIGDRAFAFDPNAPQSNSNCMYITSVTIPDSVTSIGSAAFLDCLSLTGVTIPDSVTSIGAAAFLDCCNLSGVTIGKGVASIEDFGFAMCGSLRVARFLGNAPSLGREVFADDLFATAYYLPGTTGWSSGFCGIPTMPWDPPVIQTSPQTQTAEAGSAVTLGVRVSGGWPLFCVWYFNGNNLISWGTACELQLTNVQISDSGSYRVVVSNACAAVFSTEAMLNVIAAVERKPAVGVKVMGEAGSFLNVDYANSLSPASNWTTLGSFSLTSTSQHYFDVTIPHPPQRYYRAWQTGTPGTLPSLSLLGIAPAITLTGNIGHSVRLDYINQFGPTDAWVTLATVPLTDTSQLYFDISAPGQPQRLYRLVPSP